MKDRKRATNTVNHQPKRRRVSQNIADKKHLDTNGRKLGMKICTEDQQKNNSVEPKGMSTKLRTEDRSSGSLTKRYSLLFVDPIHLFFYLYYLYELYYLFFSCRLFCLCVWDFSLCSCCTTFMTCHFACACLHLLIYFSFYCHSVSYTILCSIYK